MAEWLATIDSYVWSPALVYLCLGAGLLFSILQYHQALINQPPIEVDRLPERCKTMVAEHDKAIFGIHTLHGFSQHTIRLTVDPVYCLTRLGNLLARHAYATESAKTDRSARS